MLTDQILRPIIEGVSNTYGEQFFNTITTLLGKTAQADYCFIATADIETMQATTIAATAGGQLIDNFSYPLQDSPCEQVMCDKDSVYPAEVAMLFPKDILLAQMQIEGYIGASLKDDENNLLGIVVALFKKPVADPDPIHTIFQLFSGRIAAEIARSNKAEQLRQANEQLEQRVIERTEELELALINLKHSQKQLIEQEKFASLGNLVAGVAHEVNTPLGIGVTSASMIRQTLLDLNQAVQDRTLTESTMQSSLDTLQQSTEILETNLLRAARLVRNFKQVAVDNASLDKGQINLKQVVDALIISLHPEIKKHQVEFEIQIDEPLSFTSYPGDLNQLLTNLIINSLIHGFPDNRPGRICIQAQLVDQSRLKLSFCDDGVGISSDHQNKIFEPFFTTRRSKGSTGLGLNIIYNIVTQKLAGQIAQHTPEGGGCCYQIEFPVEATHS